jgi:hypothetical protein
MNTYRELIFIVLVSLSVAAATAAEQNDTGDRVQTKANNNRISPLTRVENPPLFDSMKSAAMRWQSAVQSKDAVALTTFALPEYKEKVQSELRKKDSVLYKFFFGSGLSVSSLFSGSKQLEYAFIAHRPPRAALVKPEGITVCYYDAAKVNPVTGRDIVQLLSLSDISTVFCMYFFEDSGKWYSNFEFSTDEGEPAGQLHTGSGLAQSHPAL